MKIKPEQLNSTLAKQLGSLYFVFGSEFLLVEQSLTHIKNTAKAQGFDDKVSFEIDANFDWNIINTELASTALFSPKRIIECRLKTGKIGVKGSKELSKIATDLPSDILLIVSTGKLDFAQQKSKWFKTLEKNGDIIQVWEMQRNNLVGWITSQMRELGLLNSPKIAQTIACQTEGNLLSTLQEIQKLKIAYPDGRINEQEYIQQLSQQSVYTVYNLIHCALAGDSDQVLKIYTAMISDKTMPIYLNNALYRELSLMINMSIELQQVKQIDLVMNNHKVWSSKKTVIRNALTQHSYAQLQKLLLSLGRIERSIKGLDTLNVIDELRILLLNLSGKTPWTPLT